MKRKFLLILTLIMTFVMQSQIPTYAENINFDTPITMKVNNKYIKTDAEPFLNEGLTYVPIRFVSEALNADYVNWDEKTKSVTISDDGKEIIITIGKNTATINGKKTKISGTVKFAKERTYVPVRFVAENMDANVKWDSGTYTVDIEKESIEVPDSLTFKRNYTDDDIYWLSRIINAESGAEPMNGKIAVANTIINRVLSHEFPNTIYGVIFDKKYGVQFQPTINGTIYNTPLGDSVIAAKRALKGENIASECMYFLNPRIATNFWIPKNREFYMSIGNHDFYL